jgi:hypothetical protein
MRRNVEKNMKYIYYDKKLLMVISYTLRRKKITKRL